MPNDALVKFAEELKEARELKKITLHQIANKIKIDIKFLQAIEEAKFDILPELYIRAFIKEYAHTVDLDPEEVIKKFDSAHLGKTEEKIFHEVTKEIKEKPATKELDTTEGKSADEQTKQSAKKLNFNYNIGLAVTFLVLILVYFLLIKESSPEIITEESNNESLEEDKPAYEIDTPKVAMNYVPVSDSLQLRINTLNRVWIKVLSDKNIRYEGMVNANSRLIYNAFKEFRVVVGNAGSVNLALNGKPINEETVGKTGEIRNLVISTDTVRAYTIIVPAKNENKSPETN